MVSPNVNKIVREIQSLNDVEREELRRLLDQRAIQRSGPTDEQRLAQMLCERGVVRTVPPKLTREVAARFRAWKPIEVPGGSLSDELIRDRR